MDKKKFIELFKKQEWYKQWEKNMSKVNVIDITYWLYETKVEEWINLAFNWEETTERRGFWQNIHIEWNKLYKDTQCKNITLSVGVEWEFWADYISSEIKRKYKIQNEWYENMYEMNDFLEKNIHSTKDIELFFEKCLETMKEIKEKTENCKIGTRGKQVDTKSIVFNGLHIHLGLNGVDSLCENKTVKFTEYLQNSRVVQWFKLKELPSFRALHSHHIWGGFRKYAYRYKSKLRFKPVIVTSIPTVELRIFDVEDIIYKTRRKKLAKFIWGIYQNFVKGEKLKIYKTPFQYNGEKMYELKENVEKCFKKSKLKHTIVYKNKNVIELKTNYQYVVINCREDSLSLNTYQTF